MNAGSGRLLLRAGFLLDLFFGPEATCSPKRSMMFGRLHGVISQETELFITTAVRVSNPTDMKRCPFGLGLVTTDYKCVGSTDRQYVTS
jgi:hypothetical protein